MPKIRFAIVPDEAGQLKQTRILADDVDILTAIGETLLGISAPDFFKQKSLYEDGELLIGRCSCGIVDCRSVAFMTKHSKEQVAWIARDKESNSWETSDLDGGALDEFTFSRSEYDNAIKEATKESSSQK